MEEKGMLKEMAQEGSRVCTWGKSSDKGKKALHFPRNPITAFPPDQWCGITLEEFLKTHSSSFYHFSFTSAPETNRRLHHKKLQVKGESASDKWKKKGNWWTNRARERGHRKMQKEYTINPLSFNIHSTTFPFHSRPAKGKERVWKEKEPATKLKQTLGQSYFRSFSSFARPGVLCFNLKMGLGYNLSLL